MWSAAVSDLDGDRRQARADITRAVANAEPEGMVGVFLDAGTYVLRLLRSLYHRNPTAFLREMIDQDVAPLRSTGRAIRSSSSVSVR